MIYLLRHGETEWNRVGRQQGRADSPLTALGRRQVHACADLLADHIPGGVRLVSSPLGRAVASAHIIRERLALSEHTVVVEEALAEHDWGEWEGLTKLEIEQRFPVGFSRRQADRWDFRVPGGESYRLLSDRARPWLEGLDLASDIVAVVHDMVSRVVRGAHLRLTPHETLKLVHPQTRIYLLSPGRVEALDAVGAV